MATDAGGCHAWLLMPSGLHACLPLDRAAGPAHRCCFKVHMCLSSSSWLRKHCRRPLFLSRGVQAGKGFLKRSCSSMVGISSVSSQKALHVPSWKTSAISFVQLAAASKLSCGPSMHENSFFADTEIMFWLPETWTQCTCASAASASTTRKVGDFMAAASNAEDG